MTPLSDILTTNYLQIIFHFNSRLTALFLLLIAYQNILATTKEDGKVLMIQLNRPRALNALNDALFEDLIDALREADKDHDVAAIVLTGNEKAFAAGADIKEMKDKQYHYVYRTNMLHWWEEISSIRKPIIGAVNGYALGGGSELAMLCDILIAGENAKFGQPEINLGTIPGMGGTQRLTRVIGKSRAMEMVLTGDFMGADEALTRGLVSRVVSTDKTVDDALGVAKKIASKSKPIVQMAKECVNQSYEGTLTQGI